MAESMKGLKRTHRCAELSAANVGEKVTIMGWVQKNRNKGGDIDWRFLIPCDIRASVRVGGAEEINPVTILWP